MFVYEHLSLLMIARHFRGAIWRVVLVRVAAYWSRLSDFRVILLSYVKCRPNICVLFVHTTHYTVHALLTYLHTVFFATWSPCLFNSMLRNK